MQEDWNKVADKVEHIIIQTQLNNMHPEKMNRPRLKILQVIDQVGLKYGGSAEVARKLTQALIERGHNVTLYASDIGVDGELGGLPLITFKTKYTFQKETRITPSMLTARFGGYDVIHIHNYYTFQNFVVMLMARGTPVVWQPHGALVMYDGITWNKPRRIHRLVDVPWRSMFKNKATRVICTSLKETGQATKLGIPGQRISFIPNGIDLNDFAELPPRGTFRKAHGISPHRKIILYLGRLHYLKGVDLLINEFEKMEGDNLLLVIAGNCDDNYSARMLLSIDVHNPRIKLVGPQYGKDKLAAFVDADVYVLPSRYDIFGITALEALACGCPVIVTENCGVSDLLYGLGWIIKDMSILPMAIKEAMGRDKEILVRARRFAVRAFDWSQIAERMEDIYEEIAR